MTHAIQLGRIGIWSGGLWAHLEDAQQAARELGRLGYGALWFPNGPGVLARAQELLDATSRVVVATGIASIWMHSAEEVAKAHHAVTQAHPGRFLLGLGVSHAHLVNRQQAGRYTKPLERMQAYLDALDAAPDPVPADERILCRARSAHAGDRSDAQRGRTPVPRAGRAYSPCP